MYRRALVPLDGSLVAETILPFILQIAGPLDLDVVLLRVVRPTPPVVMEGTKHVEIEDIEARRVDAEEYLAPLAAELEPNMLYALYQDEHPEDAARHFENKYGRMPGRIVVVGDWLYLELRQWDGVLP